MAIVDGTSRAALRAIARLSGSGLGAEALLRQVTNHLRSVIPFETGSWLVYGSGRHAPDNRIPDRRRPLIRAQTPLLR